jgi:hypothetical protein
VELLRRYSNQTDVLSELMTVLTLPTQTRDPGLCKPRQKQRRLGELEQLELVNAYRAGDSVYGLADRFGIARQTVSAVLERHGVARRYRILTPQDVDAAVRLYESGLSLVAVGERLGANASTVLNTLRKTGVRMRPVGTNQWR